MSRAPPNRSLVGPSGAMMIIMWKYPTVAGVVATGAGLVVVGSRLASSASIAVHARPSRLQVTKNLRPFSKLLWSMWLWR